MAFTVVSAKTGDTYYLHSRVMQTKGGKRTLFFFSKTQKEGLLDSLPEGYSVVESKTTGLPLLKKNG
jgi:hypothetical protein